MDTRKEKSNKDIKDKDLKIEDLLKEEELMSLETKWFKLGVELGIDYTTLERIEFNCRHDVEVFMRKMLLKTDPKASWGKIIEGAKKLKYDRTALIIEEKYK